MIKKILHWIYAFAVLITIPLSIYTCSRLSNNNALVKKIAEITNRDSAFLKPDTLIQALAIKDINEAIYITQLDKQVDTILTYTALIFGLFGLLGYISFEFIISQIKKELAEIKKFAAKNQNETKDSIANSFSILGLMYEREKNHGEAFINYILAINNYIKGRDKSDKDREDSFFELVFDLLNRAESSFKRFTKNSADSKMSSKDLADLEKAFRNILVNIDDSGIEQRVLYLKTGFLPLIEKL